jgi:small-conductance mechanosensitive channel
MVAITYECPNCHWHQGHAEDCPSWYEQSNPSVGESGQKVNDIDELERHHEATCARIRTATQRKQQLDVEIEILHQQAEQLERQIAAQSRTLRRGVEGDFYLTSQLTYDNK